MEFIKKSWRYVLGAVVLLMISGGVIYIATADNNKVPLITITRSSTGDPDSPNFYEPGVDITFNAVVDLPDFTGDSAALVANNLFWTSENPQVIGLLDSSGSVVSEVKGDTVHAKGTKAGVTDVTARFYYKNDVDGNIMDAIYDPGDPDFKYIDIAEPAIGCKIVMEYVPVDSYVEGQVFIPSPSSGISVRANTYTQDPLTATSAVNNGVINWQAGTSVDQGTVTVVKAGKTDVYIYPQISGFNASANQYVRGLFKTLSVYGAVRFAVDEVTISPTSYGPRALNDTECNLDTSDNSGITYETSNANVATMDKGVITPIGAGKATITAGVLNHVTGTYMGVGNTTSGVLPVDSSDKIDVTVPFVWLDNGVGTQNLTKNLRIQDTFQLTTNCATGGSVTYSSSSQNVATVSSSGLVTAKTGGTTIITATYNYLTYSESIDVTVNVTDKFTLSSTKQSIAVGETYDLEAMGTAAGVSVKFFINGVDADGYSGGIKCNLSPDSPSILQIKGVTEGTYEITAEFTYNGLTTIETATITVKTGVTDVTINPDKLDLNTGESAVLNVIVGPNSAYNRNVVWVSSSNDIVSIDQENATATNATITANKGGLATITVVSVADGTKYASCVVQVHEAVTGITLSETSKTINMNNIKEFVLVATVLPENTTGYDDGVNRNVIWSSTDESILKVDNNGLVTFLKPGSAAVCAQTEDGGYQAFCNFTVSVPVEEVKITSTDLILNVGDEKTLSAEVLPLTASNRTIEWTSTDPKVVTIDSNGTLKAINAGHCAIFAKSIDSGVEDYINVYVRRPVSSVKLNTDKMTVTRGTQFWLYAKILPEDADLKEVTWTSSDTEVATVDADGKVTTLKAGVTTITATSTDNGDSDYCVVTVTEAVTGITLNSYSEKIFVGSAPFTIIPTVEPIDAPNKAVTFTSTNPEIATVDANGSVTAVKGGECDIIVTTEERQLTAVCHITVIEYVSKITLNKEFSYVHINKYIDLTYTAETETATNKDVVWLTENSAVAVVDANGRVSAVGLGTTTITCKAADGGGAYATCVIQVVVPVEQITISPAEVRLISGDTYLLTTTISPSNATVKTLEWSTSNSAVATVDQDGEITAIKGGKCRIIAKSTDDSNIVAYATVYVTDKTLATALKINSQSIKIKIGESRKLTVTSTPTVITEGLGWYSTDTGIVTVDQNGNILGIKEGTANVVVYGLESGVEGICTVTVEPNVIKATKLSLNSAIITMLSGKTRKLEVKFVPTNANEGVKWYSSDTSVLVVDNTGKITTVGPGQAVVTVVTATSQLEAVCVVNSIAISKSSVKLQQYDPFMLYVDGAPADYAISWRTGNPRIATVSQNGEVIGRKPGTTTITATVDNKTVSCVVTITEATKY